MSELRSVLDALAAEDLHDFSDGQVLDRVALLVAVVNRASAELTRTVRHADATQAAETDGLKSMQSWLRGHGRFSAAAASQLVRSGRALEHLPATAAAFAAGTITAGQVATIAPIAGDDELAAAAEQRVNLGAIEESILAVAEGEAHDKLAQVVHLYRDALDPDGTEPDPTEGRRLSLVRHADGSGTGRFDLDPVGFEKQKDHPLPTTRKLAAGPWGWPYPGAAAGRRTRAVGRQRAGLGQPADAADGEAACGARHRSG